MGVGEGAGDGITIGITTDRVRLWPTELGTSDLGEGQGERLGEEREL